MSFLPRLCGFVFAAVLFCQAGAVSASGSSSFRVAGNDAVATLLSDYYAGGGYWRVCNQPSCRRTDSDWGADSATDALYLRWSITHDPKLTTIAADLLASSPRYPAPCNGRSCPWWSDTPAWDAVTAMREAEMLKGNADAVSRASAALRYVVESKAFTGGACPQIPYQRPQPAPPEQRIKTLETDATLIKAAILLYKTTLQRRYLDLATSRYTLDRRYFLDPTVPLYTVHVVDANGTCVQEAHRFFASVNGEMIWNGLALFRITTDPRYYEEAIATAKAVDASLSDQRGIFVDLQGENDVVEPLVEAMYELASRDQEQFARSWIIRNAEAALSSRGLDGSFSRFFDGPPQTTTSIWESNGGLALQIAAAALDPDGIATWQGWDGREIPGATLTELPATISFDGSGIALVGSIAQACETAHLRVFVDGVATFDRTGLWQNHDMPTSEGVRFAWRWPASGHHEIRIEPSSPVVGAAGSTLIHLSSIVLDAESVGKL